MKSQNSKRNYVKALDSLFRFCASQPLCRETLLAWQASMDGLSPSTINVRLSAVRKLISDGMISIKDMSQLTHDAKRQIA